MPGAIGYTSSIVAVIPVRDFAKAVDWYQDVLGLSLNMRVDEIPWAEFATAVPNFTIGISVNPDGAGSNGETVTFGVEDIAAARTKLESRGVQFTGPTEGLEGVVSMAPFVDLDGNPHLLAQNLMPA